MYSTPTRESQPMALKGLATNGPSFLRALLFLLTMIAFAAATQIAVAQKVQLSVDASNTGAKIDRNIFGQFVEHLGPVLMRACGLVQIPQSPTLTVFATMSLPRLKH